MHAEPIIDAIPREALMDELTKEHFIRKTNFGNNELYVVHASEAPAVMQEIGRLRELSFRDSGGGTGCAVDIDEFDLSADGFNQLIVWSPEDKEIVGGYRFMDCRLLKPGKDGLIHTPTAHLFHYTPLFISKFLPFTIELGRSFVQPAFQPSKNLRKGMYSLDNLWDGLGALIIDYPHIRYFFGKVTTYNHFNPFARDLILHFMLTYFPDPDQLVYPHKPLPFKTDPKKLKEIIRGNNYAEDYKTLVHEVRLHGENVPPLVNAYMNLSPTMRTFGTALNAEFGDVEETGILVTINDIFAEKKDRHTNTYVKGDLPFHLT
ncbi:MAG TPA: GNAT family N-acetyltransferase [Bacteroidales bacterium]|nr:GNAT family N-acetyltransferase [Bacteroidales bacterium]